MHIRICPLSENGKNDVVKLVFVTFVFKCTVDLILFECLEWGRQGDYTEI